MTRLLVDISSHGLGHLAQTAPVLAELRRRQPELQLTVISALPAERLATRIATPFKHLPQASDFGFVMHNAVDIDFVASAQRSRDFHDHWAERVAEYAALLKRGCFDALLANAAYLPLAAAAQADIPAIGMCSLNWADLFAHYFDGQPWAAPVHRQILDAYNTADRFLRVSPGMPMHDFVRRYKIGPIANLALPDPTRRERLATEGVEVAGTTPAQFGDFLKRETAKWAQVIKTAGIRID